MSRLSRPALTGLALIVALMVGLPAVALAAFTAAGSRATTATAAAFPAPGKPTLAEVTGGLKATWTATALDTGRAVDSYVLRRTVGTTTTTVCTTTSLTCTDASPSKTTTASYVVVAKIGAWTSTSAAASYTYDTTPPTITGLKLSADTGSSSSDFITDVASQTLSGTTEAGAQVTITYNGSTSTVTASGTGAFSTSLTLAKGTFDAKVTATDAAGNAASVTQAITLVSASTPASSVIVAGNTDTAVQDIDWQIPNSSTGTFCATTTITGTSTTPRAWQLLIHLDQAPYYGATASQLYYRGNSQVNIAAVPGSPDLTRITGVSSAGNPWNSSWNNALLDTNKTLTVTLCDSTPQVPTQGDSSWYTTSTAKGTWSGSQACVVLTVTPTVKADQSPFYFGWAASVDLRAAKSYLTGLGRTINYVSWTPDSGNGYQFTTSPAASNPVADSYALTSGMGTAVKAGTPLTVTACVNAY